MPISFVGHRTSQVAYAGQPEVVRLRTQKHHAEDRPLSRRVSGLQDHVFRRDLLGGQYYHSRRLQHRRMVRINPTPPSARAFPRHCSFLRPELLFFSALFPLSLPSISQAAGLLVPNAFLCLFLRPVIFAWLLL